MPDLAGFNSRMNCQQLQRRIDFVDIGVLKFARSQQCRCD
jgi:hypothetical protein